MWFGDLVTMKWWNDLWLNESFAEFASTLATAEATEWHGAWTTFAASEKAWAYRQDALPSTHPIVAEIRDLEDVYTNFDGITYAKGGSVLKQLFAWVGRENFMAGLKNYFHKHEWKNTVLRDLLVEFEATSGRDLTTWAQLWLETAGTNTLRPVISVDDAGVITSFAVEQTAPADYPTLRPHRLGIGFYDVDPATGAVVRTRQEMVDVDGPLTSIDVLVGAKRPGLIVLNDDDLAFAKIRLDADSLAFATEHMSSISDSLTRALIWSAAWDAVRDAEVPSSSFIDLVLANILAEDESTTIQTVLGQLGSASTIYAPPALRSAVHAASADAVWALAQEAPGGSDLQFQLLRSFAALAVTPEHVAPLDGLLDGSVALPGRAIDTDLRWDLLQGLVALGAAGDAEISAALEMDATATGKQAAARVRASIPTTEAKIAAFDSIVDHEEPNAIIRATAAGFNRVPDIAIIEPLIGKYISSLLPIWESRTYQMSEELIEGLFPLTIASVELRDAAANWLAANAEAAPALRRMVIEGLADVERALAAQKVASA
jgi:aminopeptidase N